MAEVEMAVVIDGGGGCHLRWSLLAMTARVDSGKVWCKPEWLTLLHP